jgi:hypothetical protein
MYTFLKNVRLLPALSAGISNLNSNVNCPSENKITREDFIEYCKNDKISLCKNITSIIYNNII